MANFFVTGANRGLGLELFRQLIRRGDRVIGTYRDSAKGTQLFEIQEQNQGRAFSIKLDVTDPEDIQKAFDYVRERFQALDVLINNAGIFSSKDGANLYKSTPLGKLTFDELTDVFRVNSVAPIILAQTFLPLLKASTTPKIVSISSAMGSIQQRTYGGYYPYSGSKAALNMLNRCLAFDLKPEKITSVVIHPGWVKTEMGGKNAPVQPQDSIAGILEVTDGLTLEDAGKFFDYQGKEIPW